MTELSATQLLPCPFCGGEAEIKPWGNDGLIVGCTWCGIKREQKVLRRSIEWLRPLMIHGWNVRILAAEPKEPLGPIKII